MKVLMVSDARNIHTKRWATALKTEGVDLILFSITLPEDDFYERNHIKIYTFDLFRYKTKTGLRKAFDNVCLHRQAVNRLKEILKLEKPDLLHAHYATSYGLIAALSGFHPYIISVWGSDVYEYPYKSFINKQLVKYVLRHSDRILSTSHVMALQTRKFCDRGIGITPFGVDTGLFRPADRPDPQPARKPLEEWTMQTPTATETGLAIEIDKPKKLTFGTVKTLSYKYGIDLLIQAYAIFVENHKDIDSRLLIAGKGKDRESLERLAERCHVADKVDFLGEVPHEELPALYAKFDIAVFLSREESFGVSVVEAMSCGCPVIVSDADGFKEIVEHDKTGLLVHRSDIDMAAQAMTELALDPEKRARLGKAARKHVVSLYEWRGNVRLMLDEYRDVISMGW